MSHRRSRSDRLIAPELARALSEVSRDINRQVGILLDRNGKIRETVVGDAHSLFLPDLSAYREGHARFCGLRLVHTHLEASRLTDDDLTDLVLLRLDLVAAIEVEKSGLPGEIHVAQLVPSSNQDEPWRVSASVPVHELPEDFLATVSALEDEFARKRVRGQRSDDRDRAVLIHVSEATPTHVDESLSELRELTQSAGIEVLEETAQRRPVDGKFVLGRGKLKGIVIRAMQIGAEVLIFDLNLSPAQVKNIADLTDLKVLDRTQVILDIFAQRAQEREGKIQVELAQLRYLLPRLSAKHTAMSRLTGGIGGRGPGETKLEIDQRRAQARIAQLQREVEKLGVRRELRRRKRTNRGVPTVSIVGYTNAGKSTLLNQLTRSKVRSENTLFATLNPASRRLRLPKEKEIILTDTVGFIRQLPQTLMTAFRTTFEEIQPASVLLLVLDASSAEVSNHYETVMHMLKELNFQQKRILVVLNKADLCDETTLRSLERKYDGISVSALKPDTLMGLIDALETCLLQKESVDVGTGEFSKEETVSRAQSDAV